MGDARILTFETPDGKTGYLPAVPVVKDYLRSVRRKADNALAEFLTLTYLNGIAKYRPHEVDSAAPSDVRQYVKQRVIGILDTRQERLRDNPEALLARKTRGLAEFAVFPATPQELDFLLTQFVVEESFLLVDPTQDSNDEDDYDAEDSEDSEDDSNDENDESANFIYYYRTEPSSIF